MKKTILILSSLAILSACTVDNNETTNAEENLTAAINTDQSNLGVYKGVFTTLDGASRAIVEINLPVQSRSNRERLLPTATIKMNDGQEITLQGAYTVSSQLSVTNLLFSTDRMSFTFSVHANGTNPTVENATYLNKEGSIIVLKETQLAPVTPIVGTYFCTFCGDDGSGNTHPGINVGQTQTFNMVFTGDGTADDFVTTQTTFGGQVIAGVGYQENCVPDGANTVCNIESGIEAVTTTGFLVNGNIVTWTGTHSYFNATDGSAVAGTWDFASSGYGLITGTFIGSGTPAPVDIVFEDFEDATVTYTLSSVEFIGGSGNSDYFTRTDGTNISGSHTGVQDVSFFAAQDIDQGPNGNAIEQLTFANLDVSSYAMITFSSFYSEDDDGGNQDWDDEEFLIVEYSFDGGTTWTKFFGIHNDGSTFNSAPFIDTDLDGIGDGAEITDTFVEHSATFENNATTNPGGSATVDVRVSISLNAGDEDIALDNISITGI